MAAKTDLLEFADDLHEMAVELEHKRHDPVFLTVFPAYLTAKARQAMEMAEYQAGLISDLGSGYSRMQRRKRTANGNGTTAGRERVEVA